MTQHLKNYRIFLISILYIFLLCVFFVFNYTEIRQIVLYDLRNDTNDIHVILEFKSKDRIYKRTITSKTTKIRLKKGSDLYSVEHDNQFSAKIITNNSDFYIYIFPNESVIEQNNSYLVKEAEGVYAYFIENYDYTSERNYYIFSKDNLIEKNPLVYENFTTLDFLYELQKEDVFTYNDDIQVLSTPYAGYVIKDRDERFILLSNLWDTNLIN